MSPDDVATTQVIGLEAQLAEAHVEIERLKAEVQRLTLDLVTAYGEVQEWKEAIAASCPI